MRHLKRPLLAGLTHVVPLISIEFHVELKEKLFKCLDNLHLLGFRYFSAHPNEVDFPIEDHWQTIDDAKCYAEKQSGDWWGNMFAKP